MAEEEQGSIKRKADITEDGLSKKKPGLLSKVSMSTGVSPFFVFLTALANYFVHYYTGFQINFASIAADAVTIMIFIFAAYGFLLAFLPFVFQVLIPGLLLIVPTISVAYALSSFISIMLVVPWWLIFAFFYEIKRHPDSAAVKWGIVGAIALGFFFFSSSFLSAVSTTDYVINQKLLQDIKEKAQVAVTDAASGLGTQWCKTMQRTDCEKKLTEEELAKQIKIDNTLGTGFKLELSDFIPDNYILIGNTIQTYYSALNNLAKPIKLSFACGFEGREPGIPKPSIAEIKSEGIISSRNSVTCELNTERKGTPNFYFNITAENIVSEGYKEILVTEESAKKEVLDRYKGINENTVLELSKEFGATINERRNFLNPRVGEEDLIQPVLQTGVITAFGAEPVLLHGVKSETEIDLALFLKNNGKGSIKSLNNAEITIDQPGYVLSEQNCGFTRDTWKEDLSKIRRGSIVPVLKCKLIAKNANVGSTASSVIIRAKIEYDYVLSESQKGVRIS